ncbi:methylmalonyl-CoA/ethylmalonyl-CoA epimerase [Nonomuraea thailandensis]|uniref:Methylmalonyl-CoA/ethylmalonyl-CoA epimerase n=1 Tax=Nonomuraea thailandensis TaxID=1188745 RepID=A0A9X2K8V9_9ACTN|nr:VOC family protein [Nonomuraea thailandensis]MCP2364538.1 methylmalonyl-CoA/ethylmalonyl-CoA epimerase [Nonomuraea thailandensis]
MRGLVQVAQHADDLDRATAFYRDVLGLRHIATYRPPGLAFFDLDGVRLLIEESAPPAVLYLVSDDLEADVARLRTHEVAIVEEPHLIFTDDGTFGTPGKEIRMAAFRDSEGNLLCLMT